MRKKKVAFITAMSITAVTFASCGKAQQETAAKANIIPDTETVLQETEELEPETEIIAEETKQLKDTIVFEDIDPTEMFAVMNCLSYYIPEADRANDILKKKDFFNLNESCTIDGKGEFKGNLYYRIQADESGINQIIEAKNLSETPPSDTTTTSTNENTNENKDDNTDNNNEDPGDITYDYVDLDGYEIGGDIPQIEPDDDWYEGVDPSVLDAAEGMTLE